eukprot:1932439-Rhodomonas_salina.2
MCIRDSAHGVAEVGVVGHLDPDERRVRLPGRDPDLHTHGRRAVGEGDGHALDPVQHLRRHLDHLRGLRRTRQATKTPRGHVPTVRKQRLTRTACRCETKASAWHLVALVELAAAVDGGAVAEHDHVGVVDDARRAVRLDDTVQHRVDLVQDLCELARRQVVHIRQDVNQVQHQHGRVGVLVQHRVGAGREPRDHCVGNLHVGAIAL